MALLYKHPARRLAGRIESFGRLPWLLAWLFLAGLFTRPLLAQSAALLIIEPAAQTMAPDDKTLVAVHIQEASDLYGVELRLAYDPTIVQVVDADDNSEGIQALPGPLLDLDQGFLVVNRADNEAGELIYAATLLAPAEPVSGEGILLLVTFRGLHSGASKLDLDSSILASIDGQELPVQIQSAQIAIGDPGEGSSVSPTAQESVIGEGQGTATSPTASTPVSEPTSAPVSEPASELNSGRTAETPSTPGQQAEPNPSVGAAAGNQPTVVSATADVAGNAVPGSSAAGDDGKTSAPAGPDSTQAAASSNEGMANEPSPNPIGAVDGALIEESAAEESSGVLSIIVLVVAFVVVAGGLFFGRRLLSRRE